MTKIQIPRHPLKKEIFFIENFPQRLNCKISKQEYYYFIKKINASIEPTYSIFYILKVLTVFPLLIFTNKKIDDELDEVLREINEELVNKQICITHPKYNNFLYLEVVFKE